MKLTISHLAWDPKDEMKMLSVVRQHGIHNLEIAPGRLFENPFDQPEAAVRELRQRYEDEGITLVAMQALLFGHPDLTLFNSEDSRQKTGDHLKKAINFGATLGASALVFGSPKNRLKGRLSQKRALEIAHRFFAELGTYAAPAGVVLCIEANPPEYGADFITRTSEAIELVQTINHESVRINLDLSTILINHEDLAEIKDFVRMIGHCHISEPRLAPVAKKRPEHQRLAQYLHEASYKGAVSIEMKAEKSTLENIRAIEEALTVLSECYG